MTDYPGKLKIDHNFMKKLSSVLHVPAPITTHIIQKRDASAKCSEKKHIPPPPPLHKPHTCLNGKINNIPVTNFGDKGLYIVEKELFERLVENHIERTIKRLFPRIQNKDTKKRFLVERNGKKSVVKCIKPTDKILDGFIEV